MKSGQIKGAAFFIKRLFSTRLEKINILAVDLNEQLGMTREEKFMLEAIKLSEHGMQNNEGGPFGCVVVLNDVIIGRGNNKVTSTNDPTAHAEVCAIRDACKNIGSYQLSDCEIYTSCEPCPMCLGAIYWARPKAVYYANNRSDAAEINFDDSMIYEEMSAPINERKIPLIPLSRDKALTVFKKWQEKQDKTAY
ncbi:MAG: deaminase [Chitinophagaceae bacterium]